MQVRTAMLFGAVFRTTKKIQDKADMVKIRILSWMFAFKGINLGMSTYEDIYG